MRRAVLLIACVVVAATWLTWLRPTALGGDVSYVIVDGSSMEPTYDDGDLVLVREETRYDHGDVIAFRAGGRFDDPTRIIHRIVGEDPARGFVTQGDNRDRTDPWFPTDNDIIGRATVHVPMAGDAAAFISRPEFFAALGGTAVIVGRSRRRRRRRTAGSPQVGADDMTRSHNAAPDPVTSQFTTSRGPRLTHPRWAFVGLLVCLALLLPVLALAWSALRAPDSIQATETIGSVDYGIGLDYRFSGPESPVYPSGRVEANRNTAGALVADGPLYSRLLERLDVTVAFRAIDAGADRMSSTYAVTVDVSTPGGWTSNLETIEAQRFDRSVSETISIDLRSVATQVASVASLTGVGGDSYTISVHPELVITGAAHTSTVDEQLQTPMTFTVEGNLISADAVESSETLPLTTTVNDRAHYAIGPIEMRTQAARAVLSGLSLVLVAGIAWFAAVLFGGVGLREPDRIAARYRSQIVDVAVATAPPGPVVMVGGIDELSRIAKVEQSVILHEDLGEGAHRYRVFLGSVTYEYETAPEHPGGAVGDEVASGPDESSG